MLTSKFARWEYLKDDRRVNVGNFSDKEIHEMSNPSETFLTEHCPKKRPYDIFIFLRGHQANIPNIAFCNNDLDTLGQYLVSTDIEGKTTVWDVWRARVIRSFRHRKDLRIYTVSFVSWPI